MNKDDYMKIENTLDRAIIFAVNAHSGATRKGTKTPYIVHPIEAVAIAGSITDDLEILSAAALHDVIEDTEFTQEDICKLFGEKVTSLVCADSEDKMTDRSASETWIERKKATLNYVGNHATYEEKIIVLSDKLSNLRSISKDYMLLGDELWERFNQKDKELQKWYYSGFVEALKQLSDTWAYKEYVRLVNNM